MIPPDPPHEDIFLELGEAINFSLNETGFDSELNFWGVDKERNNILIGWHQVGSTEVISNLPKNTILLNTEQISEDTKDWGSNLTKNLQWVKSFETWDYSIKNIQSFKNLGISNVKHLKLGYQKELARIQKLTKDIDILFYGAINERRGAVIKSLRDLGLNVVTVHGAYGQERDNLIARSKIVLNMHFYKSQIFEAVRVFYLLTNSVAVVGEVNPETTIDPHLLEAIHASKYEDLVKSCFDLINDDARREALEKHAGNKFSKFSQATFTRALIG